jgi:uncharacterized protein (TIRG00374 family)
MKGFKSTVFIKIPVSIILIGWIVYKVDISKVWEIVQRAKGWWLLAALCLHVFGYWVSGERWKVLLKAQGVEVPLSLTIKSYLVGTFFNQFLPTIVGGDVVRGMDTAKPCGSLTKSLTIILFERFTGILVLLMLVSTGIALQIGKFKEVSYWPVFVLAFLVVGTVVFLWKEGIDLAFLERRIPFRFGKAVVHKISTVLDILVQFRSHPWPLLKVILLGLALQLLFILHYFVLSIAFSLDLPFSFFMVVIPVIFLLSMLPVSINGIGVRENLFVYFFAKVSVSPEKSLAIAWMAFVMILFYALIGGVIYMVRKGEKESISEIVDESEKLFE